MMMALVVSVVCLTTSPDWDAIDIGEYTKNYSFSEMNNSRYMPLFTSRGCPFKCNYCHNNFGKAFRFRSPKNVVDEIEILVKKYKVNRFEVFDDIFNFKKDRVLEICREIKSRNLKIKLAFPNAVRGDILDEEVIDALKMAGTDYLYFAIETATPSLQKKIKKHINLKRIKKNIDYAVKKRIYCGGFFMLGFPGETREQIMDTISFALDLKIHQAAFFLLPLTKVQNFLIASIMNQVNKKLNFLNIILDLEVLTVQTLILKS